jgi:hypothetical protein
VFKYPGLYFEQRKILTDYKSDENVASGIVTQ